MEQKPVMTRPGAMAGAFKPLVDKVGVPLLWFALGFLAAVIFKRKSA